MTSSDCARAEMASRFRALLPPEESVRDDSPYRAHMFQWYNQDAPKNGEILMVYPNGQVSFVFKRQVSFCLCFWVAFLVIYIQCVLVSLSLPSNILIDNQGRISQNYKAWQHWVVSCGGQRILDPS